MAGQYLVRRVCPDCAYPQRPDESVLPRLAAQGITSIPDGNCVASKGCDACNGTGYSIRPSPECWVPLAEALWIDGELARLLATRPDPTWLRAALSERGFRTYFDQAFESARQGLVTLDKALWAGLSRRAAI